jgi:hypothetical protein
MSTDLDHSVFPDLDELPDELPDSAARADYVQRICTAWDFGIHPDQQTFALFSAWREIFDRFPSLTSPGYHAMRAWFGWPALPYPKGVVGPTPRWAHLDRIEGRDDDPCEQLV